MAKQLSELIEKINPTVVAAARAQADQEIFELRLAQLRQTVEMSQHDLAAALGISQPSVANLEKRGHEEAQATACRQNCHELRDLESTGLVGQQHDVLLMLTSLARVQQCCHHFPEQHLSRLTVGRLRIGQAEIHSEGLTENIDQGCS